MIDKEKLCRFLHTIDLDFPVPISYKVNLEDYAEKLLTKATLYSVIENQQIVALVAGYDKNVENNIAYIALVGTIEEGRRRGLATQLLKKFIQNCEENNIKGVHLYTHSSNQGAIYMYKKMGFVNYTLENEPRPNDYHLIYWIEKEKK